MHILLLAGGFSLACWILFFIFFHRDRSRYRNCYLLFLALISLIAFITCAAASIGKGAVLFLGLAGMVCVLTVPFFLIWNGIIMIRREGRSLSKMLSLGLGIALLVSEAILLYGVFRASNGGGVFLPRKFLPVAAAVISVTVIYGSLSFLIFMLYTLFLQIIPRKKDFDYVIIHGAGLLDGNRVSRLLMDRMDKAIEVYRQDPTPPILIPSGGQGADETVPEAQAMKAYLMGRGIPEDHIIPEDRSTSTLENLKFSKQIMDSRDGEKYTALVSSNFHVFRTLRYAREIGLKCIGIGSHVAFYFWPSALIREYIAIHVEKKHAVLFIAGWLVCMALLFGIVFH